jgi:hypothetical protein
MQLLSTKSYCKNEKRKEKFIQNQMIRPQCRNGFVKIRFQLPPQLKN